MVEEIFPHKLVFTNMAKLHLKQTEVIRDLVQGSPEGAARDLVRAGYVSQGGDEAACQEAGAVPTK